MTWLARSASGTGSPSSRLASCMHSTIAAGESITVPSQSNTISRYLILDASLEVRIHELLHIRGQLGLEPHLLPGQRVRKGKTTGVQEKPAHALLCQSAVELEVAVLVVADDRVAGVRKVHPNLMRPAREKRHLEEAVLIRGFQAPDTRHGSNPALVHRYPALAFGIHILMERRSELARAAFPMTLHYAEVFLADFTYTQHAVKLHEGAALFRHDEQAR